MEEFKLLWIRLQHLMQKMCFNCLGAKGGQQGAARDQRGAGGAAGGLEDSN